jgi:hypothetical protein
MIYAGLRSGTRLEGNLTFNIGWTCPNHPVVPDSTNGTLAAIHILFTCRRIYGGQNLVKIFGIDAYVELNEANVGISQVQPRDTFTRTASLSLTILYVVSEARQAGTVSSLLDTS